LTPEVSFRARLSAAFCVAAGVVVVLCVASWRVADGAANAASHVSHTQEVQAALALARVETVQIELSTQNYRITGDPARLVERDAAIAAREVLLLRLKTLTAGNPAQQASWQALREVIDERLSIARRVEALRRTHGLEAANASLSGILCARHSMRRRSMYAKQEDDEGGAGRSGGDAGDTERAD
jgi:CHASE3 domain sensor protein